MDAEVRESGGKNSSTQWKTSLSSFLQRFKPEDREQFLDPDSLPGGKTSEDNIYMMIMTIIHSLIKYFKTFEQSFCSTIASRVTKSRFPKIIAS